MIWIVTGSLLSLVIISVTCVRGTIPENNKNSKKIMRKIVARLFLALQTFLSGPILGLGIYVLYCDDGSPYHIDHQCYSTDHIFYCILATFMVLMTIVPLLSSALCFYNRNPFVSNCFGFSNRNYLFSKILIKIIFPLYFAMSSTLKL